MHAGARLDGAGKALILLHGGGATTSSSIRLASRLVEPGNPHEVSFLAPQAANNIRYPMSGFLPQEQITPWLESALTIIDELADGVVGARISSEKIVPGGFSQGAMLSLECASHGKRRIGGVIAFNGSLVGPIDQPHAPIADGQGLPMLIGRVVQGCGGECGQAHL